MKSAHLIAATLLFFGIFGCSNDKLVLKETVQKSIGPSGGTLKSADGRLELNFQLGALKEDTLIKIETHRNEREIPRAPQKIFWELSPNGLQFERDVFITIMDDSAAMGEELAVANVDGAYPQILEGSAWDAQNHFARGVLKHFSAYTAVAVYNPCAGISCGDSCTVCDPLNSACTEPPPSSKSCNRSGLCVDALIATCDVQPDAGLPDLGVEDAGEDAEVDAGIEDGGVVSCSESFTQNPQPIVDILIIMDNSCSMIEEQSVMAASFDILQTTLVNNNVDFHVGVTSTDLDNTIPGELLGTPAVLEASTPNLSQEFATHVMLGNLGSGFEKGLESAQLALTAPANPGFLRDTSSLVIIFASDEEDQSSSSTTAYSNFLLNLRGDRRIQANVIAGPPPSGCTGSLGTADPGVRYNEIRKSTGGVFDIICEAPWAAAMTNLGGSGFGYLYRFTLTSSVSTVTSVVVDGVPAPSDKWTFNSVTQTIEFAEGSVPSPSAVIEVFNDCGP